MALPLLNNAPQSPPAIQSLRPQQVPGPRTWDEASPAPLSALNPILLRGRLSGPPLPGLPLHLTGPALASRSPDFLAAFSSRIPRGMGPTRPPLDPHPTSTLVRRCLSALIAPTAFPSLLLFPPSAPPPAPPSAPGPGPSPFAIAGPRPRVPPQGTRGRAPPCLLPPRALRPRARPPAPLRGLAAPASRLPLLLVTSGSLPV